MVAPQRDGRIRSRPVTRPPNRRGVEVVFRWLEQSIMGRDPSDRHVSAAAEGGAAREPQDRHDTGSQWPSDDAFPLIKRPGYRTFWVSQGDAGKYHMRRWRAVVWGSPDYEKTGGGSLLPFTPGTPGTPVVSKDLTLYEMREADAIDLDRTDPRRAQHRAALQDGREKLEGVNALALAHGAPSDGSAPIMTFTQ